MKLVVEGNQRAIKRVSQRPNFGIHGTMVPYGLYPIMATPVLPGTTMNACTVRMPTISQPVKNPLTGTWFEQWLFYVKLTDISKDLADQFMNEGVATTGYVQSGDNNRFFTADGQISWIEKCYDKIVDDYFTDEGETVPTIDGVKQTKLNHMSWANNLTFESADVATPTTDARDTYEALTQWAMLQQMQMTEVSYEDYLETYGVRPKNQLDGRCEMLGYTRKWTRPTNVIDPSSGSPSSAWANFDDFKIDKSKRFVEPGFVVLLSTCRPKMYQAATRGRSLIGEMWGFRDWYPSYLIDDPTAGVRELPITERTRMFGSSLVTPASTKGLLFDYNDLLVHGEQFINSSDTELPYALPEANYQTAVDAATPAQLQGKYCTLADVQNLFVGSTDQTRRIAYDGMVSLTIAGHLKDTIK